MMIKRLMDKIFVKKEGLFILFLVILNFGLFKDVKASVILEKEFLITSNGSTMATTTFSVEGVDLLLPPVRKSVAAAVKISVLDEPLLNIDEATPISQIYQIEFTEKPSNNYSLNLKFKTENNFYKRVYYYDGVSKNWLPLPTSENFLDKTVSTQLNFPFVRLAVFEQKNVLSRGKASWYAFKGGLFAASPDYKYGTRLLVSSVNDPSKQIVVTVNDYGPNRIIHPERVVDLDKTAFALLAPLGAGVIDVYIQPIGMIAPVTSTVAIQTGVIATDSAVSVVKEVANEDLSWKNINSKIKINLINLAAGNLWQNTLTGGVYWVEKDTKQPLTDKAFLTSIFKGKKIVKKMPSELVKLKTLSPLKFADGSLLKTADNQTVYLIFNKERRMFVSGADFEELGYAWDDVVVVSNKTLNQFENGAAIKTIITKNQNFSLTSRAAVVLDAKNGKVLFAKNAAESMPLASLTKLVAMKVFLDTKPNLNQIVEYKNQDEEFNYAYADKSVLARLRVSDGETLTIRNLLYAAVLGSANNAVESLVRVSGLDRDVFIARMNRYVKNLGAKHTKFVEPTGLSPENVSSAGDYGLISLAALKDKNLEKVSMTKAYNFVTINKKIPHYIKNSNSLFFNSDFQITGSKTGYLEEAKYCLMTRVKNNTGKQVVVVTFGTPTKSASYQETKSLLAYGLAQIN
ncbi:MAG: RlpA-like double-psi beta-barrel domain-containing protein [bacterium]